MNVLTLEDLLEVSMFRCRICRRRLQSPVLQVGTFGNICGGVCYERSAFTDVIPNVDVETLLAKLQVPCNHKERGCTYDGSYYKTCEHERVCEFRDQICPLTYSGTCDDDTGLFHDIPAHISSCHEKCVLIGERNSPIKVPNPTETTRELFYLLSVDNKKFLLRTWLDSNEDCIFYTFYYFQNINSKNVQISLNIRWENTIFNIASVNAQIQPETAIGLTRDPENAFKVPAATLKSLNSSENVEILININEVLPAEPPTEDKSSKIQSVWIKCTECSKIQDNITICRHCNSRTCTNCVLKYCQYNHSLVCVNLSQWDWLYEIRCQNAECNQIVKPDEYDHHKDVCLYRKHACPLQSSEQCNWQGLLGNMASHVWDAHPELINQNTFSVQTSKVLLFIKDNNVFRLGCELSSDGNFTIEADNVTAPAYNKSYKWEIRVKRKNIPMMMVITDVCAPESHTKTVNIKNYVENEELSLYADITSIQECLLPNEKIEDSEK